MVFVHVFGVGIMGVVILTGLACHKAIRRKSRQMANTQVMLKITCPDALTSVGSVIKPSN